MAVRDSQGRGPAAESWDGEIVVPFCVESALSRVKKEVLPGDVVWYRRTFASQATETAGTPQRTHLHFGAVDWHATVWVNGQQVGEHRGGYDPFSFDITDALKDGDNELIVRVTDPTETHTQPRGKQVLKPPRNLVHARHGNLANRLDRKHA